MKVPFSPPRIDEHTVEAVAEVLRSGWITTGPKTKQFEHDLATYCGVERVLCLNSATAGLELMLRWFGVGPGDEVIVPAYTYCATANVVVHCGAKPVMVDVGADFNMSPEALRAAITERTKAVMPVDIGGWPCDYDAIRKVLNDDKVKSMFKPAGEHQEKLGRILLLSDAAHSFGAEYKGRKAGTLADVSVFSFHAVKNLTAAEGGAIAFSLPEVFKSEEIYRYLAIMSLHGQTKDALAKTSGSEWRYDVIDAGYKCNMTDIQAAIGALELKRYDETLARRKQIFEQYRDVFGKKNWAIIPPFEEDGVRSSFHVFLLRIKDVNEEIRDAIIKRIIEQQVFVNVHFTPLPLLTVYRERGYKMADYPVAYEQFKSEISLPVYFDLTDEAIQRVTDVVVEAVEHCIVKVG
ncbi:MAG: DegT/DnrJ/EryC1/StrS family aminotransferase [Flavobacteriales bacterium]|nr:DegT/DnrJ/EryC1/StrS family aminotransferase [Flavobacteriales bacterium]